jgi:hypothetical protein
MSSPTVLPGSSSAEPPSITRSMLKQRGITQSAKVLEFIADIGLEGLCAAYAMDWLRTRLEAKLFDVSIERIEEMAVRQAAQFKAKRSGTEPFKKTADAYKLIMGHHFDWKVPKEVTDEEWKAPKATIVHLKPTDLKPVTDLPFRSDMVYYISLTYEDQIGFEHGHGFGMDCRGTPWLADWGSGVYECTGMTAQEVFMFHMKMFAKNMKAQAGALTGARCYYLGIKAKKPAFLPVEPDEPQN